MPVTEMKLLDMADSILESDKTYASATQHAPGAFRRVFHGQFDAQSERGALLQAANDQWTHGER